MTDRFRLSPETNAVVKKLEQASVGESVSYADLSLCVGGNIQNKKRYHLDSARRILLNDKQIVFGVLPGEGLKRLNDNEIVLESCRSLNRIKRATRTGARKMGCVDNYDNLPVELKQRHNSTLSVLGAIQLFTKPSNVKKIDSAVSESNGPLMIGETMGLFR